MSPKHLLHNLELEEISLCADPANPEATITLFKTSGPLSGEATQTKEDTMSTKEEGLAKQLGAVEAKLAEVVAANLSITETNKALTAELGEALAAKTEDKVDVAEKSDDDFLKSLSPVHRARFEAVMKAAETATDTVQKMQEEALEKAFIVKASVFKNLPIEGDTFGPVLQRLSLNKATAADVTELERIFTSLDAMLGKSALFVPAGHSTTLATGNAYSKMEAAAAEFMKVDANVTKEVAMTKVMEQNPALYGEYLAERQASN